MRVIDSHVHFPVRKIIDNGIIENESETGIGYTSGSMPESEGKEAGTAALLARQEEKPVSRVQRRAAEWLQQEKRRWEASWQFPAPESIPRELVEQKWAEELVRYDYLKAVVFVTAGSNAYAGELVARHKGSLFAYAHHDPLLPDAADRLEVALRDYHLSGYKLLGPAIDVPLSDRRFDPLWELCLHYEVPVLIHFGIMGAAGGIASHVNMDPLILHDVAKRFPGVAFIVPHFGTGYVFELLNLCWACPNVFVDTSGSNQWMRWMPYDVSLDMLFRRFRETIGASRIVFGTDSSWFPRGFTDAYLKAQIRAMADVGYTEPERDAVLYRNIAWLLKIEEP